jgi:hypothetical protein
MPRKPATKQPTPPAINPTSEKPARKDPTPSHHYTVDEQIAKAGSLT